MTHDNSYQIPDNCLTLGNVDDCDPQTLKIMTENLLRKLFGDKGYNLSIWQKNLSSPFWHII